MPKTATPSIDGYLAKQPPAARAVLTKVRGALRAALPGAEEVISYQIPAFRQQGRVVIFFAGWKEHYSVYPATGGIVEKMGKALEGYEISKGTIRFPLDAPVPVRLLGRLAKLRAEIVAEEVAARDARKRPARTAGAKARVAAKPKGKAKAPAKAKATPRRRRTGSK